MTKQILDLAPTITITHPDGSESRIAPVDIGEILGFKAVTIALYSWWIEHELSIRDVVSDDHCWKLMKQAIAMHPLASGEAIQLEELRGDFVQLERLFFTTALKGLHPIIYNGPACNALPVESSQMLRLVRWSNYKPNLLGLPELLRVNGYRYASVFLQKGDELMLDRHLQRIQQQEMSTADAD